MSKKSPQSSIPQSLHDLSNEAWRFARGVQRLSFDDDSDVAVSASATQFATLMQGLVEYLSNPSSKNDGVWLEEFGKNIAPSVETIGHLVTVFREDAASGNTSLPDMNDLEIGLNLMGMEVAELYRLLELINTVDYRKPSPERSELIECLSGVGVPVAEVGLQIPLLLKILFAILAVLAFFLVPSLQRIALKVLAALLKMDVRGQGGDGGQGGGGKYGGGQGDGGQYGGGQDGGKGDGGKAQEACGVRFKVTGTGTGATAGQATRAAFRMAQIAARARCPARCPDPVLVDFDRNSIRINGGRNGQPFTVTVTFVFVCR